MKASKVQAVALLVSVLMSGLIPREVLASGSSGDTDRPIRLYATEFGGPIGRVLSPASLRINGRPRHGEQFVWNGEVVQALDGGAQVEFYGVGRVSLLGGAAARFASARAAFKDNATAETLVVSVLSGAVSFKLRSEACAYVEAGGTVFQASRGASFRLGLNEQGPSLATVSGTVRAEQAPQSDYKIQVVDELGRPITSGAQLSVRARASRQIQVRVTDKNDRPVPDAPVVFLLGGSGSGTLGSGAAAGSTVSVSTNAQGIATTSFTAGTTPATASVTATVAGTTATTTVGVATTAAAAGILTGTTLGIVAAAVAGGTVAAVVAVKKSQNNTEPITVLPPNITPK